MNAKDRTYNQLCWEMDRREPDWRMRSRSDDGGDNKTPPERGPLGPGGTFKAKAPPSDAGVVLLGGERSEGVLQTGLRGGVCRDRT